MPDGNGTTESTEDDRCRLITEVAMERAMDKCGSEEAVRRQLQRIVGLDEEEPKEDAECEMVLNSGLDVKTLANTRRTREWVMCRAWKLVKEEEFTLSSAVTKAWAEARAKGEELGFEV